MFFPPKPWNMALLESQQRFGLKTGVSAPVSKDRLYSAESLYKKNEGAYTFYYHGICIRKKLSLWTKYHIMCLE
jgi:hypothetical protein